MKKRPASFLLNVFPPLKIEELKYSAPVRERSSAISLSDCLSVRLSACVSVCPRAHLMMETVDRSSRIFLCRSPVAVAGSSSGGVAIRYVLPVLWMTSRLAVMETWKAEPLTYTIIGGVRYRGGV